MTEQSSIIPDLRLIVSLIYLLNKIGKEITCTFENYTYYKIDNKTIWKVSQGYMCYNNNFVVSEHHWQIVFSYITKNQF